MASVYYGVVKGHVIVLPKDVHLGEGTQVEVRVRGDRKNPEEALPETEGAFRQALREQGLLRKTHAPALPAPVDEYEPIEVSGEPLSQIIREERR